MLIHLRPAFGKIRCAKDALSITNTRACATNCPTISDSCSSCAAAKILKWSRQRGSNPRPPDYKSWDVLSMANIRTRRKTPKANELATISASYGS